MRPNALGPVFGASLAHLRRAGTIIFGAAHAVDNAEQRRLRASGRNVKAPPEERRKDDTTASASWNAVSRGKAKGGYVPREHPVPEPWQFDGRLGAMIHDPEDGFTEDAEGPKGRPPTN